MNKPFLLFLVVALPCLAEDTPPENPRFEEKKWEELSNHDVHQYGENALKINPAKWRHAETENYILHYRRITEARKVIRELEFNVWYVARALGAKKEDYQKKGHAYIFEDSTEWLKFLTENNLPEWAIGLAVGDELFLNVRGTGRDGKFDTYTLAHEATHAVVARLYPNRRWPLWLNEGFAEVMGSAGVAARKNQTLRRHQQKLQFHSLPPQELEQLTAYPSDPLAISQLYQSSEHIVRFLLTAFPKEKFPEFVEAILDGKSMAEAALATYPGQLESTEAFYEQYKKFPR